MFFVVFFRNFFAIGPVVFAPGTQTYATELKKWTNGSGRETAREKTD
jgi:hypothetical protein